MIESSVEQTDMIIHRSVYNLEVLQISTEPPNFLLSIYTVCLHAFQHIPPDLILLTVTGSNAHYDQFITWFIFYDKIFV